MKITRVEPIVVSVPYSYGLADPSKAQWPAMDTLLVKVETDEGVTGWGEGFGFVGCATTATAIDDADRAALHRSRPARHRRPVG